MELTIEPKRLARFLLWIVAALTAINCFELYFYLFTDDQEVYGLVDLFDFAIEHNVPTFYSATAMLLAAGLLALITRANWRRAGGQRIYWLALTCMFVFLAVDEAVAIHEGIGDFFENYLQSRNYLEAEGFLYFMWVLPYGIATLVLGIVFLRFVLGLPAPTRNRFIASGTLFLAGAVGLELFGAREADLHGMDTVVYSVLYTFEELFEMLGIVWFVYALASHLVTEFGQVRVVLDLPASENN